MGPFRILIAAAALALFGVSSICGLALAAAPPPVSDVRPFVALAAACLLVLAWSLAGMRRSGPLLRMVVFLAAAGLILSPVLAFAQAAGPTAALAADPPWQAYVYSGLATVFVAAVAWALKRFIGVQLDQQAQDNIHRAAETAALALSRQLKIPEHVDVLADKVAGYVNRSVPDAIKRLSPPASVLQDIAKAKLNAALLAKVS